MRRIWFWLISNSIIYKFFQTFVIEHNSIGNTGHIHSRTRLAIITLNVLFVPGYVKLSVSFVDISCVIHLIFFFFRLEII